MRSTNDMLSSEEDNPPSILTEKPEVGNFVLDKFESKKKKRSSTSVKWLTLKLPIM